LEQTLRGDLLNDSERSIHGHTLELPQRLILVFSYDLRKTRDLTLWRLAKILKNAKSLGILKIVCIMSACASTLNHCAPRQTIILTLSDINFPGHFFLSVHFSKTLLAQSATREISKKKNFHDGFASAIGQDPL
jgi:hypothetical protein